MIPRTMSSSSGLGSRQVSGRTEASFAIAPG
uniref:Uncharacterized protein n=1 Tax=Arundo donax TaxID=35708 RepID=A0A0A8YQZ4_ARUDO